MPWITRVGTVMPRSSAVRLPDAVDFAVGACLGVPALTAYHAVMLDGSVRGQTILVQGETGTVQSKLIVNAK